MSIFKYLLPLLAWCGALALPYDNGDTWVYLREAYFHQAEDYIWNPYIEDYEYINPYTKYHQTQITYSVLGSRDLGDSVEVTYQKEIDSLAWGGNYNGWVYDLGSIGIIHRFVAGEPDTAVRRLSNSPLGGVGWPGLSSWEPDSEFLVSNEPRKYLENFHGTILHYLDFGLVEYRPNDWDLLLLMAYYNQNDSAGTFLEIFRSSTIPAAVAAPSFPSLTPEVGPRAFFATNAAMLPGPLFDPRGARVRGRSAGVVFGR